MPNIDGKITLYIVKQRSRFCNTTPIKENEAAAKKIENSFKLRNFKLFKALPANLRNLKEVQFFTFNCTLDDFLTSVLDEPIIAGYQGRRSSDAKLLVDQISRKLMNGNKE